MSAPSLRVDWCSHDAARWAIEHHHYTGQMPGGKVGCLGCWEAGRFAGAVVFGMGAAPMSHRPFGLEPEQVCELERVALAPGHTSPVSRVLAVSVRLLHRAMPGLRLVVSFADTAQGHHGGIYQASGWTYIGQTITHAYRVGGRLVHPRTLHSRYGPGGQSIPWLREHVDPRAERVVRPPKHKYALGLDIDMRDVLRSMAQPYPRAGGAAASTAGVPPADGGANPTSALQCQAVA